MAHCPRGLDAHVPALFTSDVGQKNLDRYTMRQRRPSAETVEMMIQRGWTVVSKCRACDLTMVVNLYLVAAMLGPGYSLWNRKSRCRRLGCKGFVAFQGKGPGMTGFEELQAPNPR